MATRNPEIRFRLPPELLESIESRSDCPPPGGPGRTGGASLWVRQLVLDALGVEASADLHDDQSKKFEEERHAMNAMAEQEAAARVEVVESRTYETEKGPLTGKEAASQGVILTNYFQLKALGEEILHLGNGRWAPYTKEFHQTYWELYKTSWEALPPSSMPSSLGSATKAFRKEVQESRKEEARQAKARRSAEKTLERAKAKAEIDAIRSEAKRIREGL